MAQILLVDGDPGTLLTAEAILRAAGHDVCTASSGGQGLDILAHRRIELVLSDLRLPDMTGFEILRSVREHTLTVPVIVVGHFSTARDAVAVMRLGAADVVEKPLFQEDLLRTVEATLAGSAAPPPPADAAADIDLQAHAAARLASAMVPVLDAATDPRTITAWARIVFASPGALRTWCRIAGLSPRRSLVFARLLRAVFLSHGGQHKPENLLDVVDRRTLVGLFRFAGFNPRYDFPTDLDGFLKQQILIRDPDTLSEICRALELRLRQTAADLAPNSPHARQILRQIMFVRSLSRDSQ
jgi:CheY-like chemotaxis protein